jgi:hypothetical protein
MNKVAMRPLSLYSQFFGGIDLTTRIPVRTILLGLTILPLTFAQAVRQRNTVGEWPTYKHDLASTRYSPLSQINVTNVARLTQAWVYRPGATGGRPSPEATPIVVNGMMYLTAPAWPGRSSPVEV